MSARRLRNPRTGTMPLWSQTAGGPTRRRQAVNEPRRPTTYRPFADKSRFILVRERDHCQLLAQRERQR